jgi:Glycosyl transferase family 2
MAVVMPRLTIGIPTLGARPDRLTRAVASALGQSTPVRVTVAAQGDHAAIRELLEPYAAHPLFRIVESPATCLWENWTFAAESCDTEFFAWLQDDDLLAPHMARRVVSAFDRHPRAHTWIARCGVSHVDGHCNWWEGTGPMVPMDLMTGGTLEIPPDLVVGAAFFTSLALSPGVAFRWSLDAVNACRACPQDADLFVERIILAELSQLGTTVCDPALVGVWVHHEGNESRKQVAQREADRQYPILARHLDGLIGACPAWRETLRGWSLVVGLGFLRNALAECGRYAGASPALDEALALLREIVPPNAETQEAMREADTLAATNGRKSVRKPKSRIKAEA